MSNRIWVFITFQAIYRGLDHKDETDPKGSYSTARDKHQYLQNQVGNARKVHVKHKTTEERKPREPSGSLEESGDS